MGLSSDECPSFLGALFFSLMSILTIIDFTNQTIMFMIDCDECQSLNHIRLRKASLDQSTCLSDCHRLSRRWSDADRFWMMMMIPEFRNVMIMIKHR